MTESLMGQIQQINPVHFNSYRIRFTQKIVKDIGNENEQDETILTCHQRAHRNAQENYLQLSERCYFPKMRKKITHLIKQCTVCKGNKKKLENPLKFTNQDRLYLLNTTKD